MRMRMPESVAKVKRKEKYHIIQVAPLVRLPLAKTQVFSYLHREPIGRGSLVEAPFSKRIIPGIVMESRKDFPREGNFQLKPIRKVAEENFLSEKQIAMAEKISKYYLVPTGIVLKSMILKIARTKENKKKHPARLEKVFNNNLAKQILETSKQEVLVVGSKGARNQTILSLIQKICGENGQVLYLFSEIFPAISHFESMKKYFPEEKIALVHGNISRGKFSDAWKRIKNGDAGIVSATKIGLFLPFRKLKLVVVDESGDISHKQWDMNPRYSAIQAARMLADIHGAKIVFSNACPTVSLWKQLKENQLDFFNAEKKTALDSKTRIVNIFKEKKSSDFPIGKDLYAALAAVVNKKEKALLIVNRRGFSNYSICRSCKNILRCPHCNRALVYFEDREKFKCLHCAHKIDLLSVCPTCGSGQFSHQGIGAQMVEKKIKRFFPSARIFRIDADSAKSAKKNAETAQRILEGKFDIIIGTQTILKSGIFEDLKLVAFPDFDNLKGIPDFNSNEQIFSLLCQAKGIVGPRGEIFVQTSNPKSAALKYFESGDASGFFEKELLVRKKTGNPPFARLVKLFFKEKNKKKAERETERVFGLLKDVSGGKIGISEPYEPFSEKKRGYFYKNILIKTKPNVDFRKLPIFPILANLRKGWAVDVDPVNTI